MPLDRIVRALRLSLPGEDLTSTCHCFRRRTRDISPRHVEAYVYRGSGDTFEYLPSGSWCANFRSLAASDDAVCVEPRSQLPRPDVGRPLGRGMSTRPLTRAGDASPGRRLVRTAAVCVRTSMIRFPSAIRRWVQKLQVSRADWSRPDVGLAIVKSARIRRHVHPQFTTPISGFFAAQKREWKAM